MIQLLIILECIVDSGFFVWFGFLLKIKQNNSNSKKHGKVECMTQQGPLLINQPGSTDIQGSQFLSPGPLLVKMHV